MPGDVFIAFVGQGGPDFVDAHTLALLCQLERSLDDVRGFRQLNILRQSARTDFAHEKCAMGMETELFEYRAAWS